MEEVKTILEEVAKHKSLYGLCALKYKDDKELAEPFLLEMVDAFKNNPTQFKDYFGAKAYVDFQNYRIQKNLL